MSNEVQLIESHSSPDGLLTLSVSDEDGDIAVGFEGLMWHTHGDILSHLPGLSESDAIREFVDNLLQDRTLIALKLIDGELDDAYPTESITEELEALTKYGDQNEQIKFRVWSGKELTDGNRRT